MRYFDPFGIFIERAVGPRKWDVDGNEYIDYVMGHGALLFGHSHPYLVEAVQEQITRGTHLGASNDYESAWALAIQRLLPSAEKVRFTSSGTEATMMAVRLARAATGRQRLLRLRNHFHGWNDSVMVGGRDIGGRDRGDRSVERDRRHDRCLRPDRPGGHQRGAGDARVRRGDPGADRLLVGQLPAAAGGPARPARAHRGRRGRC